MKGSRVEILTVVLCLHHASQVDMTGLGLVVCLIDGLLFTLLGCLDCPCEVQVSILLFHVLRILVVIPSDELF